MNTENRNPAERETDKRRCDVAYAMVRSGKSLDEILAEYAVTDEEFIGWIRDGRFTEYVMTLARGVSEARAPYVWASLLSEIGDGSVQAMKLYFEICGKNRGAASESPLGPPLSLTAIREEIFGTGEGE